MKEKISVIVDWNTGVKEIENVLDKFNEIETTMSELTSLLENTSLWAGEAQEKCIQIHKMLVAYEKAVRPLYEDLQTSIENIMVATDDFSNNSCLVKSLR